MDWSLPTNVVSVDLILQARPDLGPTSQWPKTAARTCSTGPGPGRPQPACQAARPGRAHPGVLSVQAPAELRLGAEAGDLVAFCRAGWRFSDPYIASNPIPGNHGHPATEPIPFFISGGSPRWSAGRVLAPRADGGRGPDRRRPLRAEGPGRVRRDRPHVGLHPTPRPLTSPGTFGTGRPRTSRDFRYGKSRVSGGGGRRRRACPRRAGRRRGRVPPSCRRRAGAGARPARRVHERHRPAQRRGDRCAAGGGAVAG